MDGGAAAVRLLDGGAAAVRLLDGGADTVRLLDGGANRLGAGEEGIDGGVAVAVTEGLVCCTFVGRLEVAGAVGVLAADIVDASNDNA